MDTKKINYLELIEKYRFLIGGVLLLLVIASAGWLIYRENYSKTVSEDRIEMLGNRLTELENQIESLRDDLASVEKPVAAAETTSSPEPQPTADQPLAEKVAGATVPSQTVGKINLNTASVAQLDALPGIGPAYANRIIEYRQANGGFKTIDQIQNVKGIGPKTFEKLREKITVN